MAPRTAPWLLGLLLASACGDGSPSTVVSTGDSGSSTGASSSSSGAGPAPTTTTDPADTTAGPGPGPETSTGPGPSDTTTTLDDGGSSSSEGGDDDSSSSGETPAVTGCADGEREALTDARLYPDIAACSGGWDLPGVLINTAFCDRQAGDDGPNPLGTRCSVEDLCSAGFHVCESRGEVMAAGVESCSDEFWNGAFYVTRQSSEGSDTCTPIGLDDVFGCGDIGLTAINGCAPLNRGAGNLCNALPPPWTCDTSASEEAEFIEKAGPQFGGALCCRD